MRETKPHGLLTEVIVQPGSDQIPEDQEFIGFKVPKGRLSTTMNTGEGFGTQQGHGQGTYQNVQVR